MTETNRTSVIWLPILSACVAILALWFLFIDFRGLTHPQGMEQANIAREIARGNGLTTKSITSLSLYQREQHLEELGQEVSLELFPETVHAPLNPIFQSLVLQLVRGAWEVDDELSTDPEQESAPAAASSAAEPTPPPANTGIYLPDRALVTWSVLLFIVALAINGILITRLFDINIAYFTILSLIICSLFWDFIQTGLPQMLMLVLFSAGALFLQTALERSDQEKSTLLQVSLAAVCFALLCLSHWLCLWIALAALIFVTTSLREKVASALVFAAILLPGPVWWMLSQNESIGDPMGSAFAVPLSELRDTQLQDDSSFLRSYGDQASQISARDIPARVVILISDQIENLFFYLGGLIAAPIFFIALMQPFRRASTAYLRWGIALMWLFALGGMSFYGLHGQGAEANHLHMLFIPLMSAYGFAFVHGLWSRLEVSAEVPLKQNLPLIIILIVSILPLVLEISRDIRFVTLRANVIADDSGAENISVNGMRNLRAQVDEDEYVFSDIPWAVAWYADRPAIWIPTTAENIASLSENRLDVGERCAGFALSFASVDKSFLRSFMSGDSPDASYNHLMFLIYGNLWADNREAFLEQGLDSFTQTELISGEGGTPLILFGNTDAPSSAQGGGN